MRAIVIYDPGKRLTELAEGIAAGLREGAFTVELREAAEHPDGTLPLASYALVCVGSSVSTVFGGKISSSVEATVRQCSRMEGKPVAAFVAPNAFGAGKALKRLMAALERQGAMVQDFGTVRNKAEAIAFGRRLQAVVRGK